MKLKHYLLVMGSAGIWCKCRTWATRSFRNLWTK